jgi:LuxR family maltose regulon positive regulatory protein
VAGGALLARAGALMGDPAAADDLLDGAGEPLAPPAGAPVLLEDLARAREATEGLAPGALGGRTPLTAAETRVLRLLPTHHSFRGIGERLHLSRFTVKSQALAVYRKLGVGSRGEAVARARALGLLDDAPPA